jgi:asparagine N-glycosylation enzyme membrane subunit Stt3
MTTSLLLRRLCEIRTLVFITVVVVVVVIVVIVVVVVVSFISFPSFMSLVKNRRIFCTINSSIIRNQKIIMTKYIEKHTF